MQGQCLLVSYLQVAWKLRIVVTKSAISIVHGNGQPAFTPNWLPSTKTLNGKENNMNIFNPTVQLRTFEKESCSEFFTKFFQVTSQLLVAGDKCCLIIYEVDSELVIQFVTVIISFKHQLSSNNHVAHSFITKNQMYEIRLKQWLTKEKGSVATLEIDNDEIYQRMLVLKLPIDRK